VPGTNDYGPGRNRVSFLVVDKKSKLIETAQARVWVSHGLKQKPYAQTIATLEPIGVPGGAEADAQNIYVATLDMPKPGKYWILAEPIGGSKKIQALGNAVVLRHSAAPEVGEKAIPSKNPVLGPGVDPKTVTTAEPPAFTVSPAALCTYRDGAAAPLPLCASSAPVIAAAAPFTLVR